MHVRTASCALSTLALALLAGRSTAQACVDQEYLPAQVNLAPWTGGQQTLAQTFTVGRTGTLASVDVLVTGGSGSTLGLAAYILTTAGSPPLPRTVVAVGSVQASAVSFPPRTVNIDLSRSNLPVASGQVLAIVLDSAHPYDWYGSTGPGSYGGGQAFSTWVCGPGCVTWFPVAGPADFGFRTHVVPDASWSNYGSGHPGTTGVPRLFVTTNQATNTTAPVIG